MLRSVPLLVGALLVPISLTAQTELAAGPGLTIGSGDLYRDIDPSLSAGGYLVFGVLDNAQIGAAFDYSSLSLSGTTEKIAQTDFLLLARQNFTTRENVRLFVGAKGGFSRQSASFPALSGTGGSATFEVRSSGFAVGGTFGAIFDSGRFGLEFSTDILYHSFGERSVDGVTAAGSSASGLRFVPRAAVVIPAG